MKKHKIALLYGGRGLEHDVSVKGAEYAFLQIDKELFEIIPVFIKRSGEWLIPKSISCTPRELTEESTPKTQVFPAARKETVGLAGEDNLFVETDAAIPLLHGDFGEDGTPQGALENAKIPYIGCAAVESALCYDKIYTKVLAEKLGIPTAKWEYAQDLSTEEAKSKAEASLSYPMFIKPARLGSSFGASAAAGSDEFKQAYEAASKIGGGRVLIEEKADILAELECGYYSSKSKELFTKIGEIRCNSEFYDYETKYLDSQKSTVTANSSLETVFGEIIRNYSRKLAELIGISGISRFDFFLTREKKILFNEINTLPGFTESSLYPRLLECSGLSVKDALTELLLEKLEDR